MELLAAQVLGKLFCFHYCCWSSSSRCCGRRIGFNGFSALADPATAKANVCATILGLFPVGGPLPECLPGSNAYADRLLFLQVRY